MRVFSLISDTTDSYTPQTGTMAGRRLSGDPARPSSINIFINFPAKMRLFQPDRNLTSKLYLFS